MTLSKLAKLAHVSLSTASKAFSMSSEVNEDTREMIFDIARENGCFKKFYNAKYPKLVVAVICPEFKSRYYSSLVSGIQQSLSQMGCEICVASTDFSPKKHEELYDYYNNYSNVDGIILVDCVNDDMAENNVPVVTKGKSNGKMVSVSSNTSAGIKLALDYFLSKNIKDIGFVGESHTQPRLQIFREYLIENHIKVNEDYIAVSNGRMEVGGYEAAESMIKRNAVPRAILCAYDCMAIGVIRCLLDRGLRVPEDVAVIGINNNRESEFLNPSLSSVDLCSEKIGEEMSKAILNKIMGVETPSEIIIEPRLILRKSSEI